MTGTKLGENAFRVMLARLGKEDPGRVKAALSRCAEECKFKVTLADILERLPKTPDQVPKDPEAAWDMAIKMLGSATEVSDARDSLKRSSAASRFQSGTLATRSGLAWRSGLRIPPTMRSAVIVGM